MLSNEYIFQNTSILNIQSGFNTIFPECWCTGARCAFFCLTASWHTNRCSGHIAPPPHSLTVLLSSRLVTFAPAEHISQQAVAHSWFCSGVSWLKMVSAEPLWLWLTNKSAVWKCFGNGNGYASDATKLCLENKWQSSWKDRHTDLYKEFGEVGDSFRFNITQSIIKQAGPVNCCWWRSRPFVILKAKLIPLSGLRNPGLQSFSL